VQQMTIDVGSSVTADEGFGTWEKALEQALDQTRGRIFTVDDVRGVCPIPERHRWHWWGLAMARAHRAGMIRPVGISRSSRCPRHLVTRWQRT